MDLFTQILLVLVIILTLALYNRSISNNPPITTGSKTTNELLSSTSSTNSTKKSNKKKKKSSKFNSDSILDSTTESSTRIKNEQQSIVNQSLNPESDSQQQQQQQQSRTKKKNKPKSKPETSATPNATSEVEHSEEVEENHLNGLTSSDNTTSINKTNQQRREELEKKKIGRGEERVEDMVDRDIQPETTYERVARIPAPEFKTNGFAGPQDYEEWEQLPIEHQGGWESVGQGSKASRLQPINSSSISKSIGNSISNGIPAYATSNPFSALPDGVDNSYASSFGKNGGVSKSLKISSSNGNGTVKSSNGNGIGKTQAAVVNSEPTKKQRQNAAKAAAKKSLKESEEKDRLERLSKHKKQVESERMKEFYTKGSGSKSNGNGKNVGAVGGPKASVDQNGALVWD